MGRLGVLGYIVQELTLHLLLSLDDGWKSVQLVGNMGLCVYHPVAPLCTLSMKPHLGNVTQVQHCTAGVKRKPYGCESPAQNSIYQVQKSPTVFLVCT